MSAGTVAGISHRCAEQGRPLYVLWLDAHPDFHTLDTTASGNLHGTPVAYFTGRPGFEGYFPRLAAPVPADRICMIGIRSVDPLERAAIQATDATVNDMRMIDEHGVATLLTRFLDDVAANDGMLHVSLDVDFLDPAIAPAVGTTVPGGATFREAHPIMEMLHESGSVTSSTSSNSTRSSMNAAARRNLLVDLTASLAGRKVFDRPTRSY